MSDCIFCKIISGELPARKAYEDEELLAFHDIHPVAPVHILIIPKTHLVSLAHAEIEHAPLLGRMLLLAAQLAKQHGLIAGFKTVIHTGQAGGQVVFHMHMHIMGG